MLVQQIDSSIIIALIGVLGGVLPVGISYVITKNKEIDVNIRQEKTKRYDGLIDAIVAVDQIPRANKDALDNFIIAYNRAMAYASDLVLERCNEFAIWLHDIEYVVLPDDKIEQEREQFQERKRYIEKIYEAIRIDINPKAKFSEVLSMKTFKNS